MNNNELMRGNLVYAEGEVCRIESIGHGDWVSVWNLTREDTDNLLPHELTPIPITEELLRKNGFEPGKSDKSWFTRSGKHLIIVHDVARDESGLLLVDVCSPDGPPFASASVRYLHQIQNLCNIIGVEFEWEEYLTVNILKKWKEGYTTARTGLLLSISGRG